MEESVYIPMSECKPRHVYKLWSRNLRLGVWDPETKGFIGLRVKFNSKYLFTEYHWDTGAPHGTAKPHEDLGELEDEHILVLENLPETCSYCGERVEWKRNEGAKFTGGVWHHTSEAKCKASRSRLQNNTMLFVALEQLEEKYYG